MAVGKSGLFSELHGRISNFVVYDVNGQTRVRAHAFKYKDAKSEGQLLQRGKVKGVAAMYRRMDHQLKVYWKELTEGTTMNGYNLFMSKNVHNLTEDGRAIDPAKLCVCEGDLRIPEWVKVEVVEKGAEKGVEKGMEDGRGQEGVPAGGKSLRITWDTMSKDWEERMDELCIAVYEPRLADADFREGPKMLRVVANTGVERKQGECVWQVPMSADGEVWFYGFFKGKYTNEVSGSFSL